MANEIVRCADHLDELPSYSVLVALDDPTDVRVKNGAGQWKVSSRFLGNSTAWVAEHVGFRLVHNPDGLPHG